MPIYGTLVSPAENTKVFVVSLCRRAVCGLLQTAVRERQIKIFASDRPVAMHNRLDFACPSTGILYYIRDPMPM